MTSTVYLNGAYLPESEARVSIFDRGFIMADAVYEVTSVIDDRLVDFHGHMARLQRSLDALEITNPLSEDAYLAIHRRLVALNELHEGTIYLQISRGNAGERDFVYPPAGTAPTVVMVAREHPGLVDNPAAATGLRVISLPDLRWHRRDIKTVQLLYPSMCKMEAKKRGAHDAWLVEDGFVTEGTSNNAWIVRQGRVITRALSHDILHGITRAAVMRFADEAGVAVEERKFTLDEAMEAEEAFVTSATTFVMPVVEIDGVQLGDGKPGPLSRRLREIYIEESRKSAI